MIPILEDLPATVTVGGSEYGIVTDFRDWIRFEQLLLDRDMSDEEKLGMMLLFYTANIPDEINEAVEALVMFANCNKKPRKVVNSTAGAAKNEPIYDYEQDAGMIYAAFWQAYQINLAACEYLHWWEFRALLESLPDNTRMAQVMGIRAQDTRKLGKQERERIKRLKEIYAIGKNQSSGQHKTLAERDAEMLEQARRIRARTEQKT